MLFAACHAFAPTSPVGLTSVASPFRGQQLWRSVDDDSGSHSALIRQTGSPPPPLMLDEWVALVRDQHRPPTGAVAAADSDSFYGFLPSFEGAVRPYVENKVAWLRPWPDGSPEASLSARSRRRLRHVRPASANQPLEPRWPAIQALFST